MCGLAGAFALSPGAKTTAAEIQAMTDALAHRGPDDRAYALFDRGAPRAELFQDAARAAMRAGDAALGHRRLSILDLSPRGRQPMSDPEGRIWMVFNGEIYNYVELRTELEGLGRRFTSSSDSEVALQAFLVWGTGCFARFNGMWAIAFLDAGARRLVLSRDRFGKKPLYYADDGEVLLFASEVKALLRSPRVKARMNLRKVAAYAGRHYRCVDDDEESFFEGIRSVPKGCVMAVEDSGARRVEPYWTFAPAAPIGDEREQVERFKALLEDAVRIRLRADVPLGLLLSGGLDSTSIACLAAARGADVTAISGVTGDGSAYDESPYIDEVVKKTGLKARVVRPRPAPLLDTLQEMIGFHDEPVCTATWYSLYLLAGEVARQGIKVVLTGHGGDELLAGYWDHYHYRFYDLRRGPGDEAEKKAWLDVHGRGSSEYDRERLRVESAAADRSKEADRFRAYEAALAPAARAALVEPSSDGPAGSELSRRLHRELFRETVPASLRAEDRNTMAHSVENRVPFLDYRLAEFCFGLDDGMKVRGGLGKWVLREAMKGVLPEKVRLRRDKTGHNVPADAWFRSELKGVLEGMIAEENPVNEEVYDRATLARLFQEHQAGANHAMFLWQYVNLRLWHRMKIEGAVG